MADPPASCLSDQQHEVFVNVVTAIGGDWDNAFEAYFKDAEEEREAEMFFLAGWVAAVEAQGQPETPLQRDSQTKGTHVHRPGCKSKGHVECRAGPLWRCPNCRRQFCAEEGEEDAWPLFCDECYAAATQEKL